MASQAQSRSGKDLIAVVARMQDIDVARCRRLELAAHMSFMDAAESMRREFVSVPGMGPSNGRPRSSSRAVVVGNGGG
jgi:hypothetical protein